MIVRPRSIALGHHLHLLGFELDEGRRAPTSKVSFAATDEYVRNARACLIPSTPAPSFQIHPPIPMKKAARPTTAASRPATAASKRSSRPNTAASRPNTAASRASRATGAVGDGDDDEGKGEDEGEKEVERISFFGECAYLR
jgi:hypothetical protein